MLPIQIFSAFYVLYSRKWDLTYWHFDNASFKVQSCDIFFCLLIKQAKSLNEIYKVFAYRFCRNVPTKSLQCVYVLFLRKKICRMLVLETLKNKKSDFLNSKTCFCSRLYGIWVQQHSPYTAFLSGIARKELNLLKQKSI